MKKKTVFGTVLLVLFVLQAQTVQADYYDDFINLLNRNDLRGIERLLERRARQMDLTYCMYQTIKVPNKASCLDVIKLLVRYGADVNKAYLSSSSRNMG